jgi:hypothetical protein
MKDVAVPFIVLASITILIIVAILVISFFQRSEYDPFTAKDIIGKEKAWYCKGYNYYIIDKAGQKISIDYKFYYAFDAPEIK